jgi:hypothetical protein
MTVKELSETAGVSGAAQALVKEESTPSTYLDSLEKQELYQDAIYFLAYKLPIDAGIKWSSACVKEFRPPASQDQPAGKEPVGKDQPVGKTQPPGKDQVPGKEKEEKDEPLEAADQWIKAPGDPTRWAAKEAADKAKKSGPSKLTAMAVFMSGGSMTPAGAPVTPPPQYLAQKMIAASVLVAVVSHEPQKSKERYKKALALGKKLDGAG